MLNILAQKILRRINRFLPSPIQRQYATLFTYDNRFFQDPCYRYLTDLQVEEFCSIIVTLLHPKSAIDLGCGLAYYLSALKAKGVRVIGFDVSLYAIQNVDPDVPVYLIDIKKPFRTNQRFDVAICFEVAEHLPKRYAPILIESLCTLSGTILFTAAPPGQPGIDHINLQPKSFWIALFNRNGFNLDDQLTRHFVDRLVPIGTPEWFCRNFAVFSKVLNS